MTQHNASPLSEPPTVANVPLSDRPLIAEDENTVISAPEQPRVEVRLETSSVSESYRQRLFPANNHTNGEEAGIRLAHFEITSRLGSGGMGAVFRATDLELARDVALKILHPASTRDPSLVARFRNEARSCARLNHDNIARVFYAGSQEGLFFIAYEYASGSTIRDLILDRGRLNIEDTLNYAIQVTLALNHIAAAGIVHRDIKPSNIMLTETGRVKVVDLGLARRDVSDSIGDITVAGTTLGTFDYISPEQARDPRNADVRSDIYSLGCTMYHMLTGQPPYPEGTALQKLLDHQGKSPPDPQVLNSSVPDELAAIMRKMMANHPDHRYQTPGLLLNDLIQLAGLIGLHSVPAEGIVWRKLDHAGHRQPIGAVWVFVSVLLICLTAFFMQRMGGTGTADSDLQNEMDPPGQLVDPSTYATLQSAPSGSGGSTAESVTVPSPTDTKIGTPSAAASGSTTSATTFPEPKWGTAGLPPGSFAASSSTGPHASAILELLNALPDVLTLKTDAAQSTGPFILQTTGGTARTFRTLKAAVADARSGDVILLRYNGYPEELPAQPPVRIVGMNLIIRAADGFRPTLEFDGASDGGVTDGCMFSLQSQGSLSLQNVDLRLIVTENLTADRWSLFQCEGVNRVQLENVSIECQNPDGQLASVFDVTEEMAGPIEPGTRVDSEFSLRKVICRIDGDFFRIACQLKGRLELNDCGLAVNGSLLSIRGDMSMQNYRGTLEANLNHVTCLHSGPLIQMTEHDGRSSAAAKRILPRLTLRSEACVYAGLGPDSQLLHSEGSSYQEDLEALVTWNGFTNLYEGHSVFWQISTTALEASRDLTFDQWQQFWKNRVDSEDTNAEFRQRLAWQNSSWRDTGARFLLPDIAPSAFELDATMFDPGSSGLPRARDGLIPGVNAQELPPFPRVGSPSSIDVADPAATVAPGIP
jgi:serine/threonine protein kinase